MKVANKLILVFPLIFGYCTTKPELPADVSLGNIDGVPSLIDAVSAGNVSEVKKLLQAGADANQVDSKGVTLLMYAATGGHPVVVKELLQAGADVNQEDPNGLSPLILASVKGHLAVVKALLEAGADVNKEDQNGWTPLMYASVKGHLAVVKALLEAGADVNKEDPNGLSPLILASDVGHLAVVRALLQAGADASKVAVHRKIAFSLARINEVVREALQVARVRERIHEAQVKRKRIAQKKPLVFERIEKIGEIEQKILELKRDYQIALKQQRNAVVQKIQAQLIAQEKNLALNLNQFKKLMRQVTMNITDADGNTPLHKAVQAQNPPLVELIVQRQPDLAGRKNKAGQTPVELAAGRPEILRLLIGF